MNAFERGKSKGSSPLPPSNRSPSIAAPESRSAAVSKPDDSPQALTGDVAHIHKQPESQVPAMSESQADSPFDDLDNYLYSQTALPVAGSVPHQEAALHDREESQAQEEFRGEVSEISFSTAAEQFRRSTAAELQRQAAPTVAVREDGPVLEIDRSEPEVEPQDEAVRLQDDTPDAPIPAPIDLPLVEIPRVKLSVARLAAPETLATAQADDDAAAARFEGWVARVDKITDPGLIAQESIPDHMRSIAAAFPSPERFNAYVIFMAERGLDPKDPFYIGLEFMGLLEALRHSSVEDIRRAGGQTCSGVAQVGQALLDGLADQADAVANSMRGLLLAFSNEQATTHVALQNSARKATQASAELSELVEDIPLELGRRLREMVADAEDRFKTAYAIALAQANDAAEHFADGVNKGFEDGAKDTIEKSLGVVEKTLDRAVDFIEQIDDRFNTQRRYIDGLIEGGRLQLAKTGEAMSDKATKDVVRAINEATAKSVKELNAAAVSAANTYDTLRQASDERRAKKERFANAVMQGAVSLGVCIGCVALYAVGKAVFF